MELIKWVTNFMKKCSVCKIEKGKTKFYKDRRTKDGLYSACKYCHTKSIKSYSRRYKDIITSELRARMTKAQSKYRKKLQVLGVYYKHQGDRKAESKRWRDKPENKKKKAAHMKVYLAVKTGKIKKYLCEKCGKKGMAHHDDYSKPLDVQWLCSLHHYEHHKKLDLR